MNIVECDLKARRIHFVNYKIIFREYRSVRELFIKKFH